MNDDLYSLLVSLDGVRQSPKYHPEGDALFHSLQVFDLARRASDDRVMWAAALFHDVGKAIDSSLHDEIGADLLEGLLPDRAVWLVRHHLDLLKEPRAHPPALPRHAAAEGAREPAPLRPRRTRSARAGAHARRRLRHPLRRGRSAAPRAVSWERFGGLRAAIAQLAAQIMYGQEVKQYFTAKRLAAKRLLGESGGKKLRYRPMDLPSNGEIKQALLELVIEIEGSVRTRRLFAMRVVALEAMGPLERFVPRLIGSVATGHVRSGSDIDLHVFAEDPSDVELRVRELGWTHEVQRVSILKGGKVMEFTHVLVADEFPLELTVYKPRDLGTRPRSSTDGKPIVRLSAGALRSLCAKEHPELWQAYEATGAVPTLEEILAAEDEDDDAEWPRSRRR